MKNAFIKIFRFYYNGFKNMTWGKSLWLIIIIKLFIMFFILKIFFFKDHLDSNFKTEAEKSNHVINELTE